LWLRSVSAATRSTTASTKSDSTELQSALTSERLSDSEMARQAIEIAQNGLEIRLGTKFLSQPARREKVARKRS
jgi:hypothetical protein